jgi:hypothetical protein
MQVIKDLIHLVKQKNLSALIHFALLYHFIFKTNSMFTHHAKQKLLLAVFSILLCGTAFKAKAGLDSYEIYLNSKLILKQYVNQPLNLESLGLDNSNINDRLVIHYSQCNAPDKLGRGRSISVRDASGNTIKKWNFADAKSGQTGMVVPVRELLQLEKKTPLSKLSLYYSAEGHATGQLLANFHFGNKSTTYSQEHKSVVKNLQVYSYFTISAQLIFKI